VTGVIKFLRYNQFGSKKEYLMRSKIGLAAACAICLAVSVAVCFGAGKGAAPSVFFPETHYEFSPVLEGAAVVHDFVIQNKGNAMLNVARVKTG
jgi:hypothetical protein